MEEHFWIIAGAFLLGLLILGIISPDTETESYNEAKIYCIKEYGWGINNLEEETCYRLEEIR
jgi:hypothetical protein